MGHKKNLQIALKVLEDRPDSNHTLPNFSQKWDTKKTTKLL